MSRQKQVFPRNTVAQLWAHKAQDQARDPSGNFYFTGPTIYSYGSLIIGCHEFTADEAKRLHAILESCEACATVAA